MLMKPVPGTAVQGLHGVCGSMSIPQLGELVSGNKTVKMRFIH